MHSVRFEVGYKNHVRDKNHSYTLKYISILNNSKVCKKDQFANDPNDLHTHMHTHSHTLQTLSTLTHTPDLKQR